MNQNDEVKYLAHVRLQPDGSFILHDLMEHLQGVGRLAGDFAATFNSSDWGMLAGLWHDFGKYRPDFQRRIKFHSGYDPEAHLEGSVGRVDHSTAGAIHAIKKLGNYGRVLAYLIAGHHTGLLDWQSAAAGTTSLKHRLEKLELYQDAVQHAPPVLLEQPLPASRPAPKSDLALWIRLLFSCLVDADFLDTEAFMDSTRTATRGNYPTIPQLAEKLSIALTQKCKDAPATPINSLRSDILNYCQHKADLPQGIFSLTVPTGGGKTLSTMAFALQHAVKHKLTRIIYVIPYTSIIEQTANIFREIFGEALIEHHSNLDTSKETARSRLACENWDAPIIVTTSVQFFESLFACRTSRVRKLHNIVNSVVILDEVQLLPPDFLKPILNVIQELQRNYKVSFLLSTATQPSLQRIESIDFPGLNDVKEIVPDALDLHKKLKRVEIELPEDLNVATSWEDLAQDLTKHAAVLCIVNRRDDCRDLFRLMPEGTVHLSALMCGEHRSEVIKEIKSCLLAKQPLRVISTQLVEAGVDIDFPVVYRALAGLDSIAQAAGRCNREGLLKDSAGQLQPGRLIIFVSPRLAPAGHLRMAQQLGQQLLSEQVADHLSPDRFDKFFQQLYWLKGKDLDKHDIGQDLAFSNNLEIRFREAANKFHIIDETAQISIIVRYGNSPPLIQKLKQLGPQRWLLRALQRYVINIPRRAAQTLLANKDISEVEGYYIQENINLYHPIMGFQVDQSENYDPESLVI